MQLSDRIERSGRVAGILVLILGVASGLQAQTIQFKPIRSAPLGSPVGTVGDDIAATFNTDLGCWEWVTEPGVEIDLDIQAFGWGDALGNPMLGAVQATVLSDGYSNGIGAALNPKGWPASPLDGAYQATDACIAGGDGSPCVPPFDETCAGGTIGFCWHNPNWVMPICADAIIAIATPTRSYGWATAAQAVCAVDEGTVKTMGGLILEVPADAIGTYVVAMNPDPNSSFMTNTDGDPIPSTLTPACITIVESCGNGYCGEGESACDCPSDCPDVCNDGCCTGAETPETCLLDCPGFCGDGVCTVLENACWCPQECPDICGDWCCSGTETWETCPLDCACYVPPGSDCFETPCGASFIDLHDMPVPGTVFGGDALDFGGRIQLASVDTRDWGLKWNRPLTANACSGNPSPLELEEVFLVACDPIQVARGDGSGQTDAWNVEVTLSPVSPEPGWLSLDRTEVSLLQRNDMWKGFLTGEVEMRLKYEFQPSPQTDPPTLVEYDPNEAGAAPWQLHTVTPVSFVYYEIFVTPVEPIAGICDDLFRLGLRDDCCCERFLMTGPGFHLELVPPKCDLALCDTGACCLPDEVESADQCDPLLDEVGCLAAGGVWQPDWPDCNDADADGLADSRETYDADGSANACRTGTNPLDSDTDGDVCNDFQEVDAGSDPLDFCDSVCTDCNDNGIADACDIADGEPDDNGNGVPDVCDPESPPILAAPPHDIRKNRYISIDPRGANELNVGKELDIRVTLAGTLVNGVTAVGSSWWANAPDQNCISIVGPTRPTMPPDWDACPVLHLTGCPIIPTSTYEIAVVSGTLALEPPLSADTQAKPGEKWWGDAVGFFDGALEQWTGPQGVVSIDDSVAAIKTFQDPNAFNAAHTSVVDMHPNQPTLPHPSNQINKLVNIDDVFATILGFQGFEYPGPEIHLCTDP